MNSDRIAVIGCITAEPQTVAVDDRRSVEGDVEDQLESFWRAWQASEPESSERKSSRLKSTGSSLTLPSSICEKSRMSLTTDSKSWPLEPMISTKWRWSASRPDSRSRSVRVDHAR